MIGYLNLILRLTIWFLLTDDFSLANIVIGLVVCFFLPGLHKTSSSLQDWLRVFAEIIVAIPQAYWEALQMIVSPHIEEEFTLERVKPQRTSGLIFLDIFLITFTPKTIVTKYHEDGWYEVHKMKRS